MKYALILTLAIVASILNSQAHAAVWETTQDWGPEAEADYQTWVAANWNKNFFTQPGFYQNVTMDCADTVYSMRLIYSAEHGLPFAMKDPTGSGRIISNEMTRWDSKQSTARKRSFLLYVYGLASTSSLPSDTYPVEVSRDGIGSGRLLLTDPGSHHSWTIRYLSDEGIPFLLFASRPARTILFERFEYPTVPFIFPKGIRPETNAGFRAFRHPEDLLKPVWQVPGYSLEQYELPTANWSREIQKRVALVNESTDQALTRILDNACRGARERADIVSKADRLNRSLGNACMSASQYDDYSTPSRDERLQGSFKDLLSTYNRAAKTRSPISSSVLAKVKAVLAGENSISFAGFCAIKISSNDQLSLGQIYSRSMNGQLSDNPHDPITVRWGMEQGPSDKAQACSGR